MDRMLLVNVGNTHTEVVPHGAAMTALNRVLTSEVIRTGLLPGMDSGSVALTACVVPEARRRLRERWGARIVELTPGMVAGVDFGQVDTSTLGADRVANAAAAVALLSLPAVVLDCGTAITTEVVDADCCFRGGAILPGRRMLRQALRSQTGQLPEVDLADDLSTALGRDTRSAILAGVDLGVLGAVTRVLEASFEALGAAPCTVVAVGGDAPFFVRHLSAVTPGPPGFTLHGIAAVAASLEGAAGAVTDGGS